MTVRALFRSARATLAILAGAEPSMPSCGPKPCLDPDAVGLAERTGVTYPTARWLIAHHGSVEAAEQVIAFAVACGFWRP